MKLLRALLHETMESVKGSSTISKVLDRNGGGPTSCRPSIGRGEVLKDEGEVEEEDAGTPSGFVFASSSSIALIGSSLIGDRKVNQCGNLKKDGVSGA